MTGDAIPRFHLFGEPRQCTDERFVHVESLVLRSRQNDWTIRAHGHPTLVQLFRVDTGGGRMRVDGAELVFEAPCLLSVPAAVIHGFEWRPGATGAVLTLAATFEADIVRRDPSLSGLLARARVIPLDRAMSRQAKRHMARLEAELVSHAPGYRLAAEAALLDLLVAIRRTDGAAVTPSPAGRQAALVTRFRDRVEARFHLREPVEHYAAALGVSSRTLRAVCTQVVGLSPQQILDDRTLLEARRMLAHGPAGVGAVAYALGFSDPAYFSRFFSRKAGSNPSSYRRQAN